MKNNKRKRRNYEIDSLSLRAVKNKGQIFVDLQLIIQSEEEGWNRRNWQHNRLSKPMKCPFGKTLNANNHLICNLLQGLCRMGQGLCRMGQLHFVYFGWLHSNMSLWSILYFHFLSYFLLFIYFLLDTCLQSITINMTLGH